MFKSKAYICIFYYRLSLNQPGWDQLQFFTLKLVIEIIMYNYWNYSIELNFLGGNKLIKRSVKWILL